MGVKITETVLRDAHQSLIATRMSTAEMLPMLEQLDQVGYNALECWGGATFDACVRFLNEDPWDRLRTIRAKVKNTKLQMLLRGQNILGYKHYADDVDYFVQKSVPTASTSSASSTPSMTTATWSGLSKPPRRRADTPRSRSPIRRANSTASSSS